MSHVSRAGTMMAQLRAGLILEGISSWSSSTLQFYSYETKNPHKITSSHFSVGKMYGSRWSQRTELNILDFAEKTMRF